MKNVVIHCCHTLRPYTPMMISSPLPRLTSSRFARPLLVLALLGSTSCRDVAGPVEVATLALDRQAAQMQVGDTLRLTPSARSASGKPVSGAEVTWISDNPSVATVQDGLVSAVAAGTALVSAASGTGRDTTRITVQPRILSAVVDLSSTSTHSCAVVESGAAYCWGANSRDELGNGTTAASTAATRVAGGLKFARITVGGGHTCAITTEGGAYCWGRNDRGQLGNGTTTSSTVPIAVAGGLKFRSISAGQVHTCAVTTDAEAFCWGGNAMGELGTGTTTSSPTPVPVRGSLNFRLISAGPYYSAGSSPESGYTCGLTVQNELYCWGDRGRGRFEGALAALQPVRQRDGTNFRWVSTGILYTSAITTDGITYTWGGAGLSSGFSSSVRDSTHNFQSYTGGYNHDCGVTPAGEGLCTGLNNFGQLGDGTKTDALRGQYRTVAGGIKFHFIDARPGISTCGIGTDGIAYCWGGLAPDANVPRPVPTV